MKFSYPLVLATLALSSHPVSCQGQAQALDAKMTNVLLRGRELDTDDDDAAAGHNTTEVPPHNGCEFMLKDALPPQPMLVGKDFEMITTTDYKVDNEAGPTAAECRNGMAGGYPCNNVDMLSMFDLNKLSEAIGGGTQKANDVWGWTDPNSAREFALIGMFRGTAFVEISDPYNPIYLGGLPTQGSGSSWRDIKTLDNYAVIVSEERSHGMQIFDLTQLLTAKPGTTFQNSARYTGVGNAHNVFVNEDTSYAYIVGQSNCSGGLHIVDLTNPLNPTQAGCFSSDGYTHDVQCVIYNGPDSTYVGREICVASNEDTVTIIDVTNKSNMVQLSRTGYTNDRYTHQGWLTEDHQYFLFNDELDEMNGVVSKTATHLMDVRNLNSPLYKGFHSGRTSAIDHNNYVIGDYVYQANYRAGLNILKIRNLANTRFDEVGYFDIYPSNDSGSFNGMWSNYPYFPSRTIVASGIEQGLFMLKFTGGAPTSPPTTRPPTTPPPTTRPPTTRPPTSGCGGANSKAIFEWQERNRKCKYFRKNQQFCDNTKIMKFCPGACDACEYECKDATGEFILDKMSRKVWTCKEVASLDSAIRKSKCKRKKFKTTCRATCNYCR